jgi:Integrase zinc binding domain/Integrase core domain
VQAWAAATQKDELMGLLWAAAAENWGAEEWARKGTKEAQKMYEGAGRWEARADGLLVRWDKPWGGSKDKTEREYMRYAIPTACQRELLQVYHDSLWGGHTGVDRLVRRLKEEFWFPRLEELAADYVKSCKQCQVLQVQRMHGNIGGKLPAVPTEQAMSKFGVWRVDLCGPMTGTNGFSYIMTAVDEATRWLVTAPLRDKTATEVAAAFEREVICHFGIPRRVWSDNGKEFDGEFAEMLGDWGSELYHTVSDNPRGNGMIERVHPELWHYLHACMPSAEKEEWAAYLPFATMQVNTQVSGPRKHSPFRMMFGQEPLSPVTASLGAEPKGAPLGGEDVAKLSEDRAFVDGMGAYRARQAAQVQSHHQFQRRAGAELKCEVGQEVWFSPLLSMKGANKIAAKGGWCGPWEITDVSGQGTVVKLRFEVCVAEGPDCDGAVGEREAHSGVPQPEGGGVAGGAGGGRGADGRASGEEPGEVGRESVVGGAFVGTALVHSEGVCGGCGEECAGGVEVVDAGEV